MNINDFTTALRIAITTLHKTLRKQASLSSSFSMTEIETIGLLARNGPLLASELAVATRITTQSMSIILKKMDAMKLIRRKPSTEDKRKVYITLTALGHKMVEQTRHERDSFLLQQIEKQLNKEERKILEKALPLLQKLLPAGKI